MGNLPILPLLPITLLVFCLLLLRLRKKQCPPSCRRCRYDISHRPVGVTRCSECGADLSRRRAIFTRRRVRLSWRARTFAIVLLVIAAAWPGERAYRFDWRTWYLHTAPDRLIAFHAERAKGPFAKDARAEWLRRYFAGKLPRLSRDRLFDYLLAWQADTSRPWDGAMGDVLANALFYSHSLSSDRADRFVQNVYLIQNFQVRAAIRPGDPVAVEYTAIDRGCKEWKVLRGFEINGSFRGPPGSEGQNLAFVSEGVDFQGEIAAHDAHTERLIPGMAPLHMLLVHHVEFFDQSRQSFDRTTQVRQDVAVTVLPPGTPLGEPVPDLRVADAVAKSVQIAVYRAQSGQLFANVRLDDPSPVDLAFNVCVNPDHPQRAAQVFAGTRKSNIFAGSSSNENLLPIDVPNDQKFIQVQFIGNDDALRHSARLKTYWPGIIKYTVPIRSHDADHSPSSAPYVITARPPGH